MMAGGSGDVTRCKGQEVVVATDKKTGQILFHQKSNLSSYSFPMELFQHDQVSLNLDLSDPEISICSQAVLALFTEIFDKQDLDQLITETIESELIDYTLYLEVPAQGLAARATNPHLLLSLNVLVLDRWVHPLVPSPSQYKQRLGGIYTGRGVVVGPGTTLEERLLLGEGSVLGRGCSVSASSLGPDCRISDNVTIINSVLGAGVTVGPGLTITNSVLADGCVLPAGVSLGEKLLLGPGVELSPGVTVEAGSRLVAAQEGWGGEEEGEGEDQLGPKAFLYTEDDEEEDEEELEGLGLVIDPWGEVYQTESENSSDESSSDEDGILYSEEEEEVENTEHEDVKNFRKEVMESITRGLEQGVHKDNLVLEINGSKHAWNTNLSEVNQCVLFSVLTGNIDFAAGKMSAPSTLSAVVKNIKKLSPLLLHYSK